MAATLLTIRTCLLSVINSSKFLVKCCKSSSVVRTLQGKLRVSVLKNHRQFSLLTFASVFASPKSNAREECETKPFEPNDARLRSGECLKNAAGLVVDSSSAILSQTVYAIIKIEQEYVELLDALVQLIEYQVQVLGQEAEVQRIADIILEARHEISKVKRRKEDLALLFSSVEKLADSSAEVAFATGSDYASTCAGERLHSAQQEVKRVLAKSEEAEKQVALTEAKMIAVFTQYEENLKEDSTEGDDVSENSESEPSPDE